MKLPRRCLRRASAFAVAGLALSIAAAWLASIASRVTHSSMHSLRNDAQRLATSRVLGGRVRVPDDWTVRTWLERSGPGLRHDTVSECEWVGSALMWSDATSPNRTMIRFSAGWPFPALQLTLWDAGPAIALHAPAALWRDGVSIPRLSSGTGGSGVLNPRRLPLRPLWIGLAADTLFWSASAWALSAARHAWIRRLRRRRGQCALCGYPRGGLPKCPECGSA